MKHVGLLLGTFVAIALLAGCATSTARFAGSQPTAAAAGQPVDKPEIRRLGEHFESTIGACVVIRVQDEYRLIRCVEDGWIQGCYEEVLSVSTYDLPWSEWIDVNDPAADFQLKFLSPEDVAVRRIPRVVALR